MDDKTIFAEIFSAKSDPMETTNITTLAAAADYVAPVEIINVADSVAPVEIINVESRTAADDATNLVLQESPNDIAIVEEGSAFDPLVVPQSVT